MSYLLDSFLELKIAGKSRTLLPYLMPGLVIKTPRSYKWRFQMIRNLFLFIIFFSVQATFAQVVELDTNSIVHCKEQLQYHDWERNVLMLYIKNSPETNKFRSAYEQVSAEYPHRHLFAFNVFDPKVNAKENQLKWNTVKGCLTDMWDGGVEDMGIINAKTPAILLYNYDRAGVGLATPLHNKLLTKEDIVKFIQEKNNSK